MSSQCQNEFPNPLFFYIVSVVFQRYHYMPSSDSFWVKKKSTNHLCNNSFYEFFCYSQRAHCGLLGGRCSWRQPDAGYVAAMLDAFCLSDSSPGSTEIVEQGLSPVLCSLNHYLLPPPTPPPLVSLLPSAFALFSHTIIYLFILFQLLLFGKHSESSRFAKQRSRMAQMAWC